MLFSYLSEKYTQLRIKSPRHEKAEGVHHHQTNTTRNVKCTFFKKKNFKNMNKKISQRKTFSLTKANTL